MVDPTGFRTIDQLAERCGHYCWLENRLFALTGSWAGAPATSAAPAAAPGSRGTVDAEVRVVCSGMSSWHGFAAGAWWDRLPVRAGVDAGALVVPPAGPIGQALDLLAAERSLFGAFGGLVGQILPALLAAYDEEFFRTSAASEAPVHALLDLVRPRVHQEIRRGLELLRQGGVDAAGPTEGPDAGPTEGPDAGPTDGPDAGPDPGRADVAGEVDDVTGRLRRVFGVGTAIFPVARAS